MCLVRGLLLFFIGNDKRWLCIITEISGIHLTLQNSQYGNCFFKSHSLQEDKAGVSSLDNEAPNDSSVGVHKKEKAPVQPTATQIMLSQLIGGEQKNMDEVQLIGAIPC